jgi:hypothetical protein
MNVPSWFGKIREGRMNYLFLDIIISFKAEFASTMATFNSNIKTENNKLANNKIFRV